MVCPQTLIFISIEAVLNIRTFLYWGCNMSTQDLTPIIIGIADSTHYLVGVTDSNNNLFSLPQSTDVTIVSSFNEAKEYLASHHISQAYVEFQSAYDEMCGGDTSFSSRQLISI